MKRIYIIGNSGSGKSTLSRTLHESLGIPVHFLDAYFWKPGWVLPEEDEWFDVLDDLTKGDSWIIEGNYQSAMDKIVPRATHIIYLKISPLRALYRAYKRHLFSADLEQSDRPQGCKEKFDWEFLIYILTFHRTRKPLIKNLLEDKGLKARVLEIDASKGMDLVFQNVTSQL